MKKPTLFISFTLLLTALFCQENITINFNSINDITLDSVHVENTVQETSLMLMGGQTLVLVVDLTSIDNNSIMLSEMRVYPNPSVNNCNIEFYQAKKAETSFEVFSLSGQKVFEKSEIVETGYNTFKLTGLASGSYIVYIKSGEVSLSQKFIISGNSKNHSELELFTISNRDTYENKSPKYTVKNSTKDIVEMPYILGEELIFTGYANGFVEVVIQIAPISDQTLEFEFTELCLPNTPSAGTQMQGQTQIEWNWNEVADADGYKYNMINDYLSAINIGSNTSFTQNNLDCDQNYHLYVWAYNSCGVSSTCNLHSSTIECGPLPVTSPTTGRIWLDRNLGASRVANSITDIESYGDYYQWGRGTDGHQLSTSSTTSVLSDNDTPDHGDFIITDYAPNDWRSPQNDDLWDNVNSTNNPCPNGFRIPTAEEWENEFLTWDDPLFESFLKLPCAGYRSNYGNMSELGNYGFYWTSNTLGSLANNLEISSSSTYSYLLRWNSRAIGGSVRCIKDTGVPIARFDINQTIINVGDNIQFTDLSVNPTEWFWDFGDGSTSTEQNPNHVYNSGANYTVSLTVTNEFGTDTEEKTDTIIVLSDIDVYNPATGYVWMSRNMGASQVATNSTDVSAFGDLYQWGRNSDGHQLRTSSTTTTLSSSDDPDHGNFITTNTEPYDWRDPQNYELWQGINGINNPCPNGYRIPTAYEWQMESYSWDTNDAAGAFASPLKLTVPGQRSETDGEIVLSSWGGYWSSDFNDSESNFLLLGDYSIIWTSYAKRARGLTVRCIREYTHEEFKD